MELWDPYAGGCLHPHLHCGGYISVFLHGARRMLRHGGYGQRDECDPNAHAMHGEMYTDTATAPHSCAAPVSFYRFVTCCEQCVLAPPPTHPHINLTPQNSRL